MRRILACVALAVAGCGGGGSTPDAALADVGSEQAEAGPSLPYCTSRPALATVTDLSGTWVARVVGSQHVRAVGTNLYPKSVFTILMAVSQTGTTVVVDGRYCDRTQIDAPGALVPVIIPDKWAHTEKPVYRTGTFTPGSGGVPVLNFPAAVEIAGAVLAVPMTDPLPAHPTDLPVIDEDGDGHPGITINLSGIAPGSLYCVQKQITSVVAVAVAPDRLEGALTFESSQVVLDSNPASLVGLSAQSTTSPDLTSCASNFAMVKVGGGGGIDAGEADGGGAGGGDVDVGAASGAPTCAWVRANEALLFP